MDAALVCFVTAMINSVTKSTQGGKGLFDSHIPIMVPHKGKSERGLKRELKQKPRRNTACRLPHWLMLKTAYLGMMLPTVV